MNEKSKIGGAEQQERDNKRRAASSRFQPHSRQKNASAEDFWKYAEFLGNFTGEELITLFSMYSDKEMIISVSVQNFRNEIVHKHRMIRISCITP